MRERERSEGLPISGVDVNVSILDAANVYAWYLVPVPAILSTEYSLIVPGTVIGGYEY